MTADPETAEPGTAEPQTAEPETAEPETAEPGTAEPQTGQPERVAGSPQPHRGDPLAEDFDRAAPRYDLLVGLNPGYHRHLRSAARALREALGRRRGPGVLRLADL